MSAPRIRRLSVSPAVIDFTAAGASETGAAGGSGAARRPACCGAAADRFLGRQVLNLSLDGFAVPVERNFLPIETHYLKRTNFLPRAIALLHRVLVGAQEHDRVADGHLAVIGRERRHRGLRLGRRRLNDHDWIAVLREQGLLRHIEVVDSGNGPRHGHWRRQQAAPWPARRVRKMARSCASVSSQWTRSSQTIAPASAISARFNAMSLRLKTR